MTQNQGNVLGDRPAVRQSRLFREHDSGNAMKDLMGGSDTKWKTDVQEGAYAGRAVYDHNAPGNRTQAQPQMQQQQQYQQEPQQQQYQQQQPQQQQYQQQDQQQYQQQQPQQLQPQQQQRVGTKADIPKQNYHNQGAGFNFFCGESK